MIPAGHVFTMCVLEKNKAYTILNVFTGMYKWRRKRNVLAIRRALNWTWMDRLHVNMTKRDCWRPLSQISGKWQGRPTIEAMLGCHLLTGVVAAGACGGARDTLGVTSFPLPLAFRWIPLAGWRGPLSPRCSAPSSRRCAHLGALDLWPNPTEESAQPVLTRIRSRKWAQSHPAPPPRHELFP